MRYAAVTLIVATLSAVPSAHNRPQPPAGVEYRPSLLVQIGVSDLDRSIRFYRDMLGFTVTERRDDLQFAHMATNVSGLEIGLNQQENPKGSGSVVLNISVVDAASARRAQDSGRGAGPSRPSRRLPSGVRRS